MQLSLSSIDAKRGVSTTEVVIAIAILGMAVAGLGRFVTGTQKSIEEQEIEARLAWELENARERISTWDTSDISEELVRAKLPFSDGLTNSLDDLNWHVRVERESEPDGVIAVSVELHAAYQGQPIAPERLTFWVADTDSKAEINESGSTNLDGGRAE